MNSAETQAETLASAAAGWPCPAVAAEVDAVAAAGSARADGVPTHYARLRQDRRDQSSFVVDVIARAAGAVEVAAASPCCLHRHPSRCYGRASKLHFRRVVVVVVVAAAAAAAAAVVAVAAGQMEATVATTADPVAVKNAPSARTIAEAGRKK